MSRINDKMRIAIIDIDHTEIKQIESYFEIYFKSRNLPFQLLVNDSSLFIKNMNKIDIFIINMKQQFDKSMVIANMIRKENRKCLLCILSESAEFAIHAFKVHAFDFIIKPIDQMKIDNLLDEAHLYLDTDLTHSKTISFLTLKGIKDIAIDDIVYFEYVNKSSVNPNRVIILHMKNASFIIRNKISSLYEALPKEYFVIPHVAFIVNLKYIEKIKPGEILMKSGVCIPLSQKRAKSIRKDFSIYQSTMIEAK